MLGRADDQRSRKREGRKDRFEPNCGTLIKRERGTEEEEAVIARGGRFERNDSIQIIPFENKTFNGSIEDDVAHVANFTFVPKSSIRLREGEDSARAEQYDTKMSAVSG